MTELDRLVDTFTKANSESLVFQAQARKASAALRCEPTEGRIVLNALTAIVVEHVNARRATEKFNADQASTIAQTMLLQRMDEFFASPIEGLDKIIRETRFTGSKLGKDSLTFLQNIRSMTLG